MALLVSQVRVSAAWERPKRKALAVGVGKVCCWRSLPDRWWSPSSSSGAFAGSTELSGKGNEWRCCFLHLERAASRMPLTTRLSIRQRESSELWRPWEQAGLELDGVSGPGHFTRVVGDLGVWSPSPPRAPAARPGPSPFPAPGRRAARSWQCGHACPVAGGAERPRGRPSCFALTPAAAGGHSWGLGAARCLQNLAERGAGPSVAPARAQPALRFSTARPGHLDLRVLPPEAAAASPPRRTVFGV